MKESEAWLVQSKSDYESSKRVLVEADCSTYCQTIAKCQQTVEKATKAVVAALGEASIATFTIGFKHEVGKFASSLQHLSKKKRFDADRDIVSSLQLLFSNEDVSSGIRLLDGLVPKKPAPGNPSTRNTEYPFHAADASYRAPAEVDVFSLQEVRRCMDVATRVYIGCSKITSAIKRI